MLDEFKERHSPRKRYLVGVSGGRDSVALVDLLLEAGYRRLVLCHLNHGLRGRDSGQDAAFVRRLGVRHDLPVEIEKVDVRRMARSEKRSIETAAREARLRFFASAARAWRCPRVLLAHHADDQVETVLMRLFRGAGPEGLEGMRESATHEVAVPGGRGFRLELIRPLLDWWGEDIEAHVAERGLAYRDDLSNAERTFLRNRIRHDLIPMAGRMFGRDVRSAVWRLAEISGAENDYFRDVLEDFDVAVPEIPVRKLRAEPMALQRRWIRAWLGANGVAEIGFREVEAVRRLANPEASAAKINLPGDRHARRRAGKLFLE